MKKFTLMLMAALLSANGFAQKLNLSAKPVPAKKEMVKMQKRVSALPSNILRAPSAKKVDPYTTSVIAEAPAGTAHDGLVKAASGYYFYLFSVMAFDEDMMVGSYVEGDDGNVYVKNPISEVNTGYLKLAPLNGDTLVAHLPQAVYDDGEGNVYYAAKSVINADGSSMVFDTLADGSVSTDVKYILKHDTLTMIPEDGAYLALMSLDGQWTGFADATQTMYPAPWTPVTLPEGAKIEQYTLNNKQLVNVAFVDDKIYVNEPTYSDSTQWFAGTIDGNKCTFKSGQYLGPREDIGFHLFFEASTYKQAYDSAYAEYYNDYELADDMVLTYDPATKSLTTPAADSVAFVTNAALDRIYYLSVFEQPSLKPFVEKPGTPVDPVITQVTEYSESYGAGVRFSDDLVTTDGNFMDPSKIYWNMYFDGSTEPETFYADDYQKLTEDMVNVPLGFNDGYDFSYSDGATTFYHYVAAYDSIGVSVTYTGGGESHTSNIVWHHSYEFDGIKGVTTDNAAVKSVAFYDLSGRRVINPKNGLYIKETVYADGKKAATKTLVK